MILMKKLNRVIIVFVLLLMLGAIGAATLNPQSSLELIAKPVSWLVLTAAFFLILGFTATLKALDAMKFMLAQQQGKTSATDQEENEEGPEEEEDDFLGSVLQKITDATPVEEEEKVATDHNYDGIRELDNNLPPWWLAGFYISIIFAVVYLLRYHVFQSAPLQLEEYKMEMAQAKEEKEEYQKTAANLVDESNVTMVEEESRLQKGKQIFLDKCAVCHQKDGGGQVGPNLTDDYWIHGSKISDVFETVKYGVPEKGMVPWEDKLSPADMQNVASYVLTLWGTEPSDPKEPQGELVERDAQKEQDEQDEGAPADSTASPETASL